MNINKILKVYFVFILSLSAMGALSYSSKVENYVVSVLHSIDQQTDQFHVDISDESKKFNDTFVNLGEISSKKAPAIVIKNSNPELISFKLQNNPTKAYSEPGKRSVEIMEISLLGKEKPIELKKLVFKVSGVEGNKIKKAYLSVKGKVFSAKEPEGDYFIFDGLNYNLDSKIEGRIKVLLDLSEELKTGSRIHLDIEDAQSVELKVGGEDFGISQSYPVIGKYLTIAKARKWSNIKLPQGALTPAI